MFKLIATIALLAVCVSAKPNPQLLTSSVEYVAPVVTATSSQVFARNYNGVVAAPIVSAAYTAPYVAAAYSAPLAYSYSPYAAAYTSLVV